MNEETLSRLDALAAKLGATGSELFGLLADETRILGFAIIAAAMVMFAILARLTSGCLRTIKGDECDDDTPYLAGLVGFGFGALVSLSVVIIEGLPRVVAPHLHVIETIFG